MSFSEYLASLNGQIHERLNSPLLLSFTLSWAAWNYKVFIVLFSGLEPAEKFDFMRQLYLMPSALFEGALLYPAFSAIAFVLAYPFLSRQVLRYSIWQDGLTRVVKAAAAEGRVLLPEEAKLVHEHYKAIIKGLDSEVDRKTEQSAKYKDALEKAEALVVEGKLVAQKLTEERVDQVDELNRELGTLKEAHEKLSSEYGSSQTSLAETMNQVLMADRLLEREKERVASLTTELEIAKKHVDTLVREVSLKRISPDGKRLEPVLGPDALKGLESLVKFTPSRLTDIKKLHQDDS